MSIISFQCYELRRIADKDNVSYEASDAMYRAADTIWELRNKLSGVVDQQDEIERLKAENAKLRKSLEFANNEWEKESMEYLSTQAENAKLRELVMDMFDEIEVCGFDPIVERHGKSTVYYEEDPYWRVGIRERVRELGIEVDG